MKFFKHYCTMSHSSELKKLEECYGLIGIGFYWKLVEMIKLCNGVFPMSQVLCWSTRGLRKTDILNLVSYEKFGLFSVDDEQLIHAVEIVPNLGDGYSTPSTSPRAGAPAGGPAGATVGTPAGEPASAPTGDGVRPGHSKPLQNRRDESKKGLSTAELLNLSTSEGEKNFYQNMLDVYPRVSSMPTPLTYEQMNRLLQEYPLEKIASTLKDMENYAKLGSYMSANLTLRKWLRE